MKKVLRWLGVLCMALLLLLAMMLAALYVPAVQRWVVAEVMDVLSRKTGYTCSVGRVHLRFPFSLQVDELCLVNGNDTLLGVGTIRARAALRPLLEERLAVDYLVLEDISLHTDTLLYPLKVDGGVGRLSLRGANFAWVEHTLHLDEAMLSEVWLDGVQAARRDVEPPPRRTFPLCLFLGHTAISSARVGYATSLQKLYADVSNLTLKEVAVDTLLSVSLKRGGLQAETLHYRSARDGAEEWHLTAISAGVDSLRFDTDGGRGVLSSLTLREEHGIVVEEARLAFSVADSTVRLPYFALRTGASALSGHLRSIGRQAGAPIIDGDINGSIGYADAMCIAGMLGPLSAPFYHLYPIVPLEVDMAIDGPLNAIRLTHCHVALPTAFAVDARGTVAGWPNTREMEAQVDVEARIHDLDFLTALLDTALQERVVIPHDVAIRSSICFQSDSLLSQLHARFVGGAITLRGSYHPQAERYALTMQVDTLDMHHILPTDNLGVMTWQAAIAGTGFDWHTPDSHLSCSVWVDSFNLAGRTYSNIRVETSLHDHRLSLDASCADTLMRFAMQGKAQYAAHKFKANLYAHVFDADLQALGISEVDIHPSFQSHWALVIDSAEIYTLHARLSDITLASAQRVVRPQPLALVLSLAPDSIALEARAGDLHLVANAHAYGLPWHWSEIPNVKDGQYGETLSAMQLTLRAGDNNPISNYLSLTGVVIHSLHAHLYEQDSRLVATASVGRFSVKGMEADTATFTAHYVAGLLRAQAQVGTVVWSTPMVRLSGAVGADMSWDTASPIDSLRGALYLSGVRFVLPSYSLGLTARDTLVLPMSQGRLLLHDVALYASGKQPLLLNGSVVLLGQQPSIDMRLDAQNVSLLQGRHAPGALLYGTALISGSVGLAGPFAALNLSGALTLRGGSSLYYIYKDASLASNNKLNDVVTFVAFSSGPTDVVPSKQSRPIGGFSMNLNITIDPTVQLDVMLGSSGENSGTIQGGGVLNVQYIPAAGLRLSGRYSVTSGTLQMNVPLLHVHTMTIRPGSTVQWSGNALNPLLNVVMEDQIRASVTIDDMPQTVLFVAGISLSDTMERLGLQFTLSAPESASMQNILASLSPDERSKLSIALLTTGLYLGEGGTGNLMNTALISFLQSQLDNISRDTFRSVDVSFGIEPLQDGVSGVSTRTDYSFSIAKRLWHDRIRIVVGGSVTTSNERIEDNAIIDNISVEWRIKPNGSQYLRFFYDKNFESILEGEIREAGVGYIYRKQF